MPHQNMPLGHKDYLELSAVETEQTQEELSALPVCLKAERKFLSKGILPALPQQEGENNLITGD